METKKNKTRIYKHIRARSFRSDYEGWKHDNNVVDFFQNSKLCFRSDYEGWKPAAWGFTSFFVFFGFRSDYEGWKHKVDTRKIFLIHANVLEVTMRDGNATIMLPTFAKILNLF